MTGDTRAAAEPALGEQAIAQAVADEPGPLTTDREDGLDGGGREHPQSVAQAHVYRILTGRSFFELERHFDRYPTIRESLGLEDNLDHSSFSYSMREQFEGMETFFQSYADYVRDRIEAGLPNSLTEPYLETVDVEDDTEPLPEIPEEAKDEKIRHVRAIMLEETDFDAVISNSQQSLDAFTDGDEPDVLDVEDVPDILWKARRPYGTFNYEDSPKRIIRRQKQRWRVENAYAEKKTKLMARTGSRDHGVRVFLFWLSTLLYNGWMLTRKFLREDFPNHRPKDRGAVELTTFIKKILRLDYG